MVQRPLSMHRSSQPNGHQGDDDSRCAVCAGKKSFVLTTKLYSKINYTTYNRVDTSSEY